MIEFRSLFKTIFGVEKQSVDKNQTVLKMLNDFSNVFYTRNYNDNAVVKACINTIATHASKFEIQHRKYQKETIEKINGDINYILSNKPNPINNSSQFIYKIVYNLYAQNNSFVYIAKDKTGMITGFYPITASSYELLEDRSGKIYLKFRFMNGQTYELPYEELIHLRRFYNQNEIFGDNNSSLQIAVDTSDIALQGIVNAIKTSNSFRGLLKYTNGMLSDNQMKNYKEKFVSDYLTMENSSGIAMLDGKVDFEPIKVEPITLTDSQLNFIDKNIFKYYGLNENIISSNFTEDEWNSFYESVLEPLAIQMEQEFSNKIFSNKAIKEGHRITFNVERIRYCKTETKINMIKEIGALGILTIDEARKILDMSPIGGEEGAKRLQTLNVVNSELADQYQTSKGGDNTE